VSGVDVRSFVLDPKIVRDFMTKFWITSNISFKKIASGFSNIDSCVSFTSDMWNSVQNLGYTYFIDEEWNLHKHLINFKQVPHPHNVAAIHSTIMNCL
jgi:hypothetical protein